MNALATPDADLNMVPLLFGYYAVIEDLSERQRLGRAFPGELSEAILFAQSQIVEMQDYVLGSVDWNPALARDVHAQLRQTTHRELRAFSRRLGSAIQTARLLPTRAK